MLHTWARDVQRPQRDAGYTQVLSMLKMVDDCRNSQECKEKCSRVEITKLICWHQRIVYICGSQLRNPCGHIYQAGNEARLTAVSCCDCAGAMFQLASPNYGVVASDGIQKWSDVLMACRDVQSIGIGAETTANAPEIVTT